MRKGNLMMQKIFTRPATAADAALVAELGAVTFSETYFAYNTKEDMVKYLRENFTNTIIANEIEDAENIYLLAYMDNEPAGYVKLVNNKKPEVDLPSDKLIELNRIYSLKKFIGKGIGKALMLACFETSRKIGREYLWLGVWQKNEAAIAFYTKFGFEIFGTHTFILGTDAQEDWLMRKMV